MEDVTIFSFKELQSPWGWKTHQRKPHRAILKGTMQNVRRVQSKKKQNKFRTQEQTACSVRVI